jgi:diguanylate cyclase (GGDEF)-like protein
MNNLHFFKRINSIMLCNYTRDDLYTYKKAQIMLDVSIFLLFASITSIIAHHSLYSLEHLMLIGDIILIFGIMFSISCIRRGKIVSAGTIAMITAILTVLLQNVIGDIVSPLGLTKYRYIETLIFLSMGYPIAVSFAFKKFQLYLYMALSTFLLASHFIVLKYIIRVDIGYDYLIFLTAILIPAVISIINFNLINESIESLIWSKSQVEEWNKSLEIVIDARTNELKEANQKLEAMSMTDGLTEIANRRKFDIHYLEEWNRAKRNNKHLTVLALDVDQFKLFNDSFGHQQGDKCLQLIAKKLESYICRDGELIARYGGEEFGIIIPEIVTEKALQYAELVRSEIESLGIPQSQYAYHSVVTVSIGVVSRSILLTDSPDSFLMEADKALYKAKENGRNRVELAD